MSEKHLWYSLIPARDRMVVDAAAKWLRPVPWQWVRDIDVPLERQERDCRCQAEGMAERDRKDLADPGLLCCRQGA